MTRYYYKAIDPNGKMIEGQVEASNESDLESRISHMKLELVRYRTETKPLFTLHRQRIEVKELITFTYHMEQLLKAGVPLVDALTDLRDSVDNDMLKNVISGLIENIGTGKTFSQALAEYPKVFSEVYVSMVHVGENSGQLVRVLQDLAGMLKWQFELATKARRMLTYPVFVLVLVLGVIMFLMTYLVPKLIPFIKLAGGEFPWHTKALIATSGFVMSNWYLILMVTLAALVFGRLAVGRSYRLRYKFDVLKLRVWVIGPVLFKIRLARFCNYFALMYNSGISVLDSIMLARQIMNNRALEDALEKAHDLIADGESISASFSNVGLFPPLVVRMLRVGENTGAMGDALLNVSYFYDKEVKDTIDGIEPLIVPVITIILGSIVGWIMLSVMGPIYDAVVKLSAFR
ncbi:MAG TPA: type II secretion system F family protein [Gammaproteobacteria bacterium]|nr:type II secretion system F family protein [Gammaproteobacteria bacterium]